MPAFVPAAARTMLLFEAFARERRELSNAEIAKLLDMPETSCVDLLHTLLEAGYLMRTARSRPSAHSACAISAATIAASGCSRPAKAIEGPIDSRPASGFPPR